MGLGLKTAKMHIFWLKGSHWALKSQPAFIRLFGHYFPFDGTLLLLLFPHFSVPSLSPSMRPYFCVHIDWWANVSVCFQPAAFGASRSCQYFFLAKVPSSLSCRRRQGVASSLGNKPQWPLAQMFSSTSHYFFALCINNIAAQCHLLFLPNIFLLLLKLAPKSYPKRNKIFQISIHDLFL